MTIPALERSTRAPKSTGRPWPLGVEWIPDEEAFNFALFRDLVRARSIVVMRKDRTTESKDSHSAELKGDTL